MKIKGGNMVSGGSDTDKLRAIIYGTHGDEQNEIESFDVIPTGIPTLDKILGGGFILGGTVEIAGLEASGKSTLAAMVTAQAQKKGYPVIYLDTEAAMSIARLKNIGVKTEDLIYMQPRCLEDVYNMVKTVVKSKIVDKAFTGPALIVWDSLAATPALKEVESEDYDKEMAIRARVNSAGLRKLIVPLSEAKVCFLIVNQYRENVGQMFGDKYLTPGGHGPKYAAIQRLKMANAGNYDIDRAAGIVGKKIDFKTIKNKIHQPLLECTSIFNNNLGMFDPVQTAFEHLKENKRINSSGPTWILNLNEDLGNQEGVIKFKRTEFGQVYEENKQRIYEVL
jgi:protein RecA